jgi:hypothetical protein
MRAPVGSWLLCVALSGCGKPSEPCACTDAAGVPNGHGVTLCDGGECTACQCLTYAPPTEDPQPATVRFVDADASRGDGSEDAPWPVPDWDVLDQDVASGHVLVVFDAGDEWPDVLEIGRTDDGPNRIVLDGHQSRKKSGDWIDANGARASVPGVSTGDAHVVRSRITVRGFDVTGSKDKGIFWSAGDDIVIEDNLVHANKGSPSISLDYTSRTDHRSTSFVVRNNHVWDQHGECIYIGGAEGEDRDAHEVVVIENNLVHDCNHPLSSQHDGINIKDRIGSLTVARNVVFDTHWGIELASPGLVRGNLVFSTASNGIHGTDEWGLGLSGLVLEDNAVLDPGDAGLYLNATVSPWSDVELSRLTVVGARQAAIEVGGESGIEGVIDDIVLADSKVGLDAWSPMAFTLGECTVHDLDLVGDRRFADLAETCVDANPHFGDLSVPAGPDGRFFTADDPWASEVGGARPTGG